MSDEITFSEARDDPQCPHCENRLAHIEYRKQKLPLGFLSGFEWIIVLSCPRCEKVIGTTNR